MKGSDYNGPVTQVFETSNIASFFGLYRTLEDAWQNSNKTIIYKENFLWKTI